MAAIANPDEPNELIRLVLGVSRLGEQGMRGWWSCQGLGRGGRYVLDKAFPRTSFPAALELDIFSAAQRHDDLLERPNALHLFSSTFPYRRWSEGWLAEQKTLDPDPLFEQLAGWDVDSGTEDLGAWANQSATGEAVGHGVRIGEITETELLVGDQLGLWARKLVSAYLDQEGDLHPPYFDLKN